ncbi:hypothetical protein, partial [Salmonella sp. gx-f7]|uniref:hypothetical protein n=1 Tax=Salmonella sp. gx-f7 TaxID=2582606 RepID=UPI001F23E209
RDCVAISYELTFRGKLAEVAFDSNITLSTWEHLTALTLVTPVLSSLRPIICPPKASGSAKKKSYCVGSF